MSLAPRFYLWCAKMPHPGALDLAIHPRGSVPRGTDRASSQQGPAWYPVTGPLPLGYAEALQRYLEAVAEKNASRSLRRFPEGEVPVDSRSHRFGWGGLIRFGRFARLSEFARLVRPHPVHALRRAAERWLAVHAPWQCGPLNVAGVAGGSPAEWTEAAAAFGWEDGSDDGVGARMEQRDSALVAAHPEVQAHALELVSGRRLFAHEITSALAERGVSFFGSIDGVLDPLVQEGHMTRRAGVGVAGVLPGHTLEWQCRRCLSPRVGFYPCHRCGLEACPQCDDCRTLGVSTACTPLYERPLGRGPTGLSAPGDTYRDVRVELPFALSPSQTRVSTELAELQEDALIWAACGAGKTEVTLEAISRTVRRGGSVLFALPRRDVVDQLGKRLDKALVGIETVTLRGGTPHRYQDSPVIVATVHQALRFCERFDLVIVDEVDAFPLNREVWLLKGLERAKRPGGRMVLMTATPPERLLRRLGKEGLRCLTLPGRPHGHPLPVPEVALVKGLEREVRGRLAVGVEPVRVVGERREFSQAPQWLVSLDRLVRESLGTGRRVLLFVPSVRLAGSLARWLQQTSAYQLWDEWARSRTDRYILAAVHAGDQRRSEKIAAFERGKIDLLVSTSILERGITLPRLDVVVFAADDERVFDAAALVQMAGRVGRSPQDPWGRVTFFAGRATPAMNEAIAAIRRFNEIARSQSENPHFGSQVST